MTQFALILHFYQPPTQSLNLTEEILRSCYLPLCDLLLENDQARISLNISGSLLLQTQAIPDHDLSQKIRRLAESGKVDFLNSPIYHPISPFTPKDVLERQLSENQKILDNFCGVKKFSAIFPPELAIDNKTAEIFGAFNTPIIVDQSSVPEEKHITRYKNITIAINNHELTDLIRSYPTELNAEKFSLFVESNFDTPVIVGSDAEVFGHHYSERINFLRDLFAQKRFEFVKISELANPEKEVKTLIPSSWQTSQKNILDNNPFPLWKNPKNPLQQKYYTLAKMAHDSLIETNTNTIPSHQFHSAEVHLDKGISSCHPYWLSNEPWWHPDLVEKGARELIRSIRTVPASRQKKQAAEKFYHQFLLELWEHQWSGEVEKKYQEHDKNRENFLQKLPKI